MMDGRCRVQKGIWCCHENVSSLCGNKDFDRKAREELRKYAKVVRRVLVARPAEPSRIFNRRKLRKPPS